MTHSDSQPANDGAGSEQRRYPRLCCGGVADVRVIPSGGKETGSLVNLSKRGCCFLADEPLRGVEGSRIEVHLKVRGIDIQVAGVIRHVHKGIRAGIEFVALSDRKCEQIDELMGELIQMDQQAGKLRQEGLKQRDAENAAREERVQADQLRRRVLRFYRS